MKRKKKVIDPTPNPAAYLENFYSPARAAFIAKDPVSLSAGERLRRERYLRRFTLDKMSGYLGISTSYLAAMERGTRRISTAMQERIHQRLGISRDYLSEGLHITGTMIAQSVKEEVRYETPVRHRIEVLLNIATQEELTACYSMLHTYLIQERNEKRTFLPDPGEFLPPLTSEDGQVLF